MFQLYKVRNLNRAERLVVAPDSATACTYLLRLQLAKFATSLIATDVTDEYRYRGTIPLQHKRSLERVLNYHRVGLASVKKNNIHEWFLYSRWCEFCDEPVPLNEISVATVESENLLAYAHFDCALGE